MSRFFRPGADDSSTESSSDEEELYSEEEEEEEEEQQDEESEEETEEDEDDEDSDDSSSDGGGRTGAARFLKGESSESGDSDDEVRTKVKSAKDKRFEELEATIKHIENAQKIDDWGSIATEYDKLNRQVAKLAAGTATPKVYIRAIADLEDYMNETIAKQKVSLKKMNATSARGLNAVKQKIKKNNKEYHAQIEAYRADNDAFMESEEEEEIVKPKKVARFIDETTAQAQDDDEGFAPVDKRGKAVQYTPETILKHLRTIMESRGKKNTDRLEQIKVMEKLHDIAVTPYQKIRVLLTLISARFDLGSGAAGAMPVDQWKAAEQEFSTLLQVLNTEKEYVVVENAEEWDDDEKAPTLAAGEKYIKVPGSIVSYVERLDDELTRSLQSIDPHTPEYKDRLRDANHLRNIIFRSLLYYEYLRRETGLDVPQDSMNRIVMRRLDHIYFMPEQVVRIVEENCWKAAGDEVESSITPRAEAKDPRKLVQILSNYLFNHSEGILKARAMLCHIYFLALHDDYNKARELALMSHMQETISNFDIQTQILFNRTLAQLGLCAFRKGQIYEAQQTLHELCEKSRQKELLAQGVMMQRYSQVSPEQERLEKQRQLPFHMHINLELLECVYLTCSMLLDIPQQAQTGTFPETKKRVISKLFKRMLDHHENQLFNGPPENTRDYIMHASKKLANGDWKEATEYIHSIKIWSLMKDSEEIKAMLAKQIQEEGLRTFLFTYAPYYVNLSINFLSEMFELDRAKVLAIVMKMMSEDEFPASLDNTGSFISFRQGVQLSRAQSKALALAEKASALIETNERILEQRTQGSANAFDRQGARGGRGGARGGQRGGRGGGRGAGGHTQSQAGGTQFTGGALGDAVRRG